jgi:hypothetical protein
MGSFMSHPKESAPRQTNGLGTSGHPRNLAQLAAKKAELKAELKAAQRRTRMNKTLISIEKLKQILSAKSILSLMLRPKWRVRSAPLPWTTNRRLSNGEQVNRLAALSLKASQVS